MNGSQLLASSSSSLLIFSAFLHLNLEKDLLFLFFFCFLKVLFVSFSLGKNATNFDFYTHFYFIFLYLAHSAPAANAICMRFYPIDEASFNAHFSSCSCCFKLSFFRLCFVIIKLYFMFRFLKFNFLFFFRLRIEKKLFAICFFWC